MRAGDRATDALRPVSIEPGVLDFAEGSVLVTLGRTRVLCAATLEPEVPPWMQGRGTGWVTGEYAMLPRATLTRTSRETRGVSGRTQEIRRLIGRSLRASVDLTALGERTIIVDCDVIQADGGTRTASITGGYVALALALKPLIERGELDQRVFREPVAAVSVGIVAGESMLDLSYEEDSTADVDMNVVMSASGELVEVQGTAEGRPFARERLDELLNLAYHGIMELVSLQQKALS